MTRFGIYRLADWPPVILLGLAAVLLGMVGFEQCGPDLPSCHPHSVGDALMRSVLLIRSSQPIVYGRDPNLLVVAQILMYVALAWFALNASIKVFLRDLRHDVQLARAQRFRGHVVVCGLGETGLEIVRGLNRSGHKVVAITREDAAVAIAQCDRLGVPVLSADATRAETLDHAGIAGARVLVATTGSDATNLDIVMAAGTRSAQRVAGSRAQPPLLVRPEIHAPWLVNALVAPPVAIFDAGLFVHSLRTEEVWARRLLDTAGFVHTSSARPRIVLAGLGDLRAAILRHAALSSFALPGVRAEILAYDSEVEARASELRAAPWRHFLDVKIKQAYFGPPDEQGRVTNWASIAAELAAHPPDAVIVALGDDDAALGAAVGLRGALDRLRRFATPVHVRTRKERGLSDLLGRMAARPLCHERLAGFGDLPSVVGPAQLFDEEAERMARAVHEDYLASNRDPNGPAAKRWEQLAERFRRLNRAFADHIPVKLRGAGLRLAPGPGPGATLRDAEIELMARAEHYRWRLDQLAAGWRFGRMRDEAAKTHDLLVAWERLPRSVQEDNLIRIAKIPRIAAEAGLAVRRLERADLAGNPTVSSLGQGAIALLEIDVADESAWEAAEALAATTTLAVHAHGLGQATLGMLQDIAKEFPRAAAAVEAWADTPDAPAASRTPLRVTAT